MQAQELLSWSLLVPTVIALITLGFGVLTLPKRPEFTVAKSCFCIAAIYAGIKVFMWGIATSERLGIRALICIVLFGGFGFLLVEGFRLVNHRQKDAMPEQQTKVEQANGNVTSQGPSASTGPPVTVEDEQTKKPPELNSPPPSKPISQRSRRKQSPPDDGEDILLGRKKTPNR